MAVASRPEGHILTGSTTDQHRQHHHQSTGTKDDNEKLDEIGSERDQESIKDKANSGGLKDYFVGHIPHELPYTVCLLNSVGFKRVFRYADRIDISLYLIAFTGAIIAGATLPLMTIVFGSSTSIFNDFASGQRSPEQFQSNINSLVLYFVYLFVGRFLIGYVATLCICIAAARTTNNVRKAFLNSLLRQEISYFDLQNQGSVASQVTTNGNRINQGIAEKLYSCVTSISLLFSSFIVALAVQWKLALIIIMSVIPASILVVGGPLAADAPIEARIVKIYSRAGTIAQDALGSIKTIQAFGAQKKVIGWYDNLLQAAHKEGSKKSILYGILFSCQTFVVMAGIALAFWQGFRMFQSGEIKAVGTVFTVVLSVTLGATSAMSFLPSVMAITNASSATAELFSVIDKETKLDPLAISGAIPAACAGHVEFRDVHFAYPARPDAPVLQGLTLSLPAGKTTALVGPSGCGKSTVVGLIERWYDPTSGQILLDGEDISELNTQWLRTATRIVQQEPTLFQGTVFENVTKGLTAEQRLLPAERQLELVQQACKAADADTFVQQMPLGYQTQLGERASMLSGGQRQRLSIARSIISEPQVLLCDEATSALDPRAEQLVQAAIDRVSRGKTTLIIAHRLSTVMAADHIVVMADGKVNEEGTHQQLVDLDGLYAAMVRAQDLGTVTVKQEESMQADSASSSQVNVERRPSLYRSKSTKEGGKALDIEAAADQKLQTETMGYSLARCIFIMLKEHSDLYRWYSVLAVAMIAVGGTYPAQAILFSRLIAVFNLQGSEAQKQANFYSLMFLVLALGNLVGYFLVGIGTNTIGQALTHRYRREMIERVVNFDQDFFDLPENNSGALTARLSSVPSAIQELMSANLGLMLNVIVNIMASSLVGIAFGWKLGLILVAAGMTIIVGSGYIRIRLDQKLEISVERQFSESASLAAESVSAIKTISSLTLESVVLERYSSVLDGIIAKVVRNLIPTLVPYALSQSADFLVMGLGFWLGSRWIASGEYTVSTFFIIFLSVIFGGQAAAQFFAYTTSITKATGSANYLLWLRTVKPKINTTEEHDGKGPAGDDMSVQLERVDFAYKQRGSVKVLKDISMQIAPGKYAAFVGPSGCGKSTIVSLLERFYDPMSGRIIVNDRDIRSLAPHLYRKCMSLVQQEPPLFLGSVKENITLGLDEEPDLDQIQEACRQANALDFVSSLPEGLNTPCGSRGLQFSGGQRQRIAVARALIRNPKLLLLDEATSALDTQSERIVQQALDEAAMARTMIAVAHRLSTIRHADVIFVIEAGRIAEVGKHEELLARRGRYHAMCLAQSLDRV
ncbi:putative ABC transporter [Elsinoe ampelina]|uniref:Putative ABC transporter n=1 Tax=Elsinoe ampelina TaxID=302913 RepID=A0A6A6FZW7_9PEZI|nr:putative ABC transporter [Elsinoe ampelina]